MSKEDNKTFLSSVIGTKPLKKTNKVKKPIPRTKAVFKNKIQESEPNKSKNNQKSQKHKTTQSPEIETNKVNKKLKKGEIQINKKIDLHGNTLFEAKELFVSTINSCYFKKERCILFITGKGLGNRSAEEFSETRLFYGKIRGEFMNWCNLKEVKNKILNIQQAGREQGGDGAFFVYLRKNKN